MSNITVYSFYNNKGGVGKTTLCSHVSTLYAKNHPKTMVLVIDMCPQANISQFLLGGGKIGYEKTQELQTIANRKNIVGFIDWVIDNNNAAFSSSSKLPISYAIQVSEHNNNIKENLYLVAGDSFLETLSFFLNYEVINPRNRDAWKNYMTVIRRLCEKEFERRIEKSPKNKVSSYENMVVFIDCNPSFSIYTQMALLSSDRLITPMMADYSSIEGIKGIFTLLYGKYPSIVQEKYIKNATTFNKQVNDFGLKPPVIYQFVFNNYTANKGIATAYESLQNDLNSYCYERYKEVPDVFHKSEYYNTQKSWENGFVSKVKDFHTAGKVTMTLGIPMCELMDYTKKLRSKEKIIMPDGSEVTLLPDRFKESIKHVEELESRL